MTGRIDYRDYWKKGFDFQRYLREEVEANPALWQGIYRTSRAPEWAVRRAIEIGGAWKLLVLAEDWCGDASNTVPILAALAEAVPNVELRILKRDENPELMNRYLTNGTRSIPIAILLDESFEPAGRWGPRPAELQEYVLSDRAKGERPVKEIYAGARRWYARDRGETTLRELLSTIEAAVPVS